MQKYTVGLAPGKKVHAGDYVTLSPHRCMTHDNSWPVALKFMSIGATRLHDNKQVVMTLDHDVQNKSETNLKKYRQIEDFAARHGVDFYPAGRGIGHQIMVEEGYAWPGTVTVASDSHSNMYGGIGCLGTPVVRTDAASIWATGRTWWQIPPIAKVQFKGTLRPGVTGKDVIIGLCLTLSKNEVLNHAIEFTGSKETMESIPIDHRLTIANMTTEWGALVGLFPVDNVLKKWLNPIKAEARGTEINVLFENPLVADEGASYAKVVEFDLNSLQPLVAGPNSVKDGKPVAQLEAENIKVNKTYLVSCTNSRASDIKEAADVFRHAAAQKNGIIPKIAPGVHFYIAAASLPEQKIAEQRGDWQVLLEAGATTLPSGCGPCIGLGTGLLEPGEVGVSASNRNFKGRMGSTEAKAYLASPAVVAASALKGMIAGPEQYMSQRDQNFTGASYALSESGSESNEKTVKPATKSPGNGEELLTQVLPGFPESISGEIVFCDADNINTDGIYPGKYTYQDGVTREQMARVCMENYDSRFADVAQSGDILVAGFNFGTGSSREQAATAILAKGIPLVVAASFSNIFSRNSINNALMGVEVPRLVQRLREAFGGKEDVVPTRRTGWTLTWDVRRSRVEVQEGPEGEKWTQKVGELPPNVQEIIAKGGLEKWVKAQIGA